MVTWRTLAHQPPPSTSAASYRCWGTPCRPARKITIEEPTPQKLMMMSAGMAQVVEVSQRGPSIPNQPNIPFSAPRGANSQIQMSAMPTPDVTEGM